MMNDSQGSLSESTVMSKVQMWVSLPLSARGRAVILGVVGVGVGLLCTEWMSRLWLGEAVPWFIAPMGASAVLLFMLPVSPLAQPWAVVGGNVVSALIGVGVHHVMGASGWSAAVAGAAAVGAMYALRCLHPPGGAVALMAVLGGASVDRLDYGFVLWPVGLNSLIMVLMALAFNNITGRRYPHRAAPAPSPHLTQDRLPSQRLGVTSEDLDAALASFGEVLDIDREDLAEIVTQAHVLAQRRQWGEVQCQDIMSHDVVVVRDTDRVEEAWLLLARHKVKALPVTDAGQRLVGIVSLHDFFMGKAGKTLRGIVAGQRVHQIMSKQVVTARPDQSIADLVSAFSDGGLHHMPVIDAGERVVGMVTQSDLVAALFQSR